VGQCYTPPETPLPSHRNNITQTPEPTLPNRRIFQAATYDDDEAARRTKSTLADWLRLKSLFAPEYVP